MSSFAIALSTMVVFTGLQSDNRELWVAVMLMSGLTLIAVITSAFFLSDTQPGYSALAIHAWTPLLVLSVSAAVSLLTLLAFNVNEQGSLTAVLPAGSEGAAGVVGGLATLGGLVVEGSRRLLADHRTPWLAERQLRWLIGTKADRLTEANTELWHRLWGSNIPDDLWTYKGIKKTLEMAKPLP